MQGEGLRLRKGARSVGEYAWGPGDGARGSRKGEGGWQTCGERRVRLSADRARCIGGFAVAGPRTHGVRMVGTCGVGGQGTAGWKGTWHTWGKEAGGRGDTWAGLGGELAGGKGEDWWHMRGGEGDRGDAPKKEREMAMRQRNKGSLNFGGCAGTGMEYWRRRGCTVAGEGVGLMLTNR